MLTRSLTALLTLAILGCSVQTPPPSRVAGDDGGDQSATFGLSFGSDGNYTSGREGETIAFADGFRVRDPSRTEGGRRNEKSLFDSFMDWWDKDDSPSDGTSLEKGKPLNKEADEKIHFIPSDLPAATEEGEKKQKSETFDSLNDARIAFERQRGEASGGITVDKDKAAAVARALKEMMRNGAKDHNSGVQTVNVSAEDLIRALEGMPLDRFKTRADTPEGESLRQAGAYLDVAAERVAGFSDGTKIPREKLVEIAKSALSMADDFYAAGDVESGDAARELAILALDMSLSMTPGVGFAKDLVEAVTGHSILTGEKLDDFSRAAAVLGVITGGVGGTVLKGAKGMMALGKLGARESRVFEALSTAGSGIKLEKMQIRIGSNGKYAAIGRGMGPVGQVEKSFARHQMQLETFSPKPEAAAKFDALKEASGGWLTPEQIKSTESYAQNKDWIERKVNEGYTIIDIGNQLDLEPSAFYDLERSIVWGTP